MKEELVVDLTEVRAAAAWPAMPGTVAATVSLSLRLQKSTGPPKRGIYSAASSRSRWDGAPPWLYFQRAPAAPHLLPRSVLWLCLLSHQGRALISHLSRHLKSHKMMRNRLAKGPPPQQSAVIVSQKETVQLSSGTPNTWCNLIFLYRMNQKAKWRTGVK